jgi:hypothetical protein
MDHPLFQLLCFPDEVERSLNPPAQKYVRDGRAIASTAVDVKEMPQSYVFVADMPGLKSADIKVKRITANCPYRRSVRSAFNNVLKQITNLLFNTSPCPVLNSSLTVGRE